MQPFINIDLGGPAQPLLKVNHLLKYFRGGKGREVVQAVDDISFTVMKGETLGVVGESGCGKSTTARLLMQLLTQDSGELIFDGQGVGSSRLPLKAYRRQVQMVFQDTLSSLNPRSRVGALLEEPLIVQGMKDGEERRQKVMEILGMVGLSDDYYFRYPHELSGGQVQRLGIARALIIDPKLIICDEPVSALDVSIQSQILNMLTSLQREMNLSLLFISHDIGVVRYISSRIGVMYLGTLVEEAGTDELFSHPLHPYTQALFASIPDFNKKRTVSLKGELPMYTDEFKGCVFHTRCPYTCDQCRRSAPELEEIYPGHRVACHRMGGIAMK